MINADADPPVRVPRPRDDLGLLHLAREDNRDGFVVLRVSGEIDLCTAPLLRETLTDITKVDQALVVDLTRVTFMDGTGLEALVATRRRMPASTTLHLVTDQPQIIKLFAITGLTTTFPIFPTLSAATT